MNEKQMLELLQNKTFRRPLYPHAPSAETVRFFTSVSTSSPDTIEASFPAKYENIFERDIVDIIHENGWHISFRDYWEGEDVTRTVQEVSFYAFAPHSIKYVHIYISPDRGALIEELPPPVLYHVTPSDALGEIDKYGLRLGVGSSRHAIMYAPRIFLTNEPTQHWGAFELLHSEFPNLAIVAVKAWLLPEQKFYRDPNNPHEGFGSCYVTEPIPREAVVLPDKLADFHERLVEDSIPKVKVPKRIKIKYNAYLARKSKTPWRTAFFNMAASSPIYDKLVESTPIGERIERFITEGSEKYTPEKHPWREGPVEYRLFRRRRNPRPPKRYRRNTEGWPHPITRDIIIGIIDRCQPELERMGIKLGKILNCGDYGCAFLTPDGRVVKFTKQKKEADAAHFVLNHPNPHENLPKIDQTWVLEGCHEYGPLYIIRRESLDDLTVVDPKWFSEVMGDLDYELYDKAAKGTLTEDEIYGQLADSFKKHEGKTSDELQVENLADLFIWNLKHNIWLDDIDSANWGQRDDGTIVVRDLGAMKILSVERRA